MIPSPSATLDAADASIMLIDGLGPGSSYGVPYDTAWVARHERLFPESAAWLAGSQRPDGSWGGAVEYPHDRLVSTLASILALSRSRRPQRYARQVERGEAYLSGSIDMPRDEERCTIGFELLFPTLMEEAEGLGLNIPRVSDEGLRRMREEKLSLVYNDMVYGGDTTLSFSVEFLGGRFDVSKARGLLNPNGSVGNSPSATAYYMLKEMSPRALGYMEAVLALNGDGSAPPVHPFDVFERAWSFYHFDALGLPVRHRFARHVGAIREAWTRGGVGTTRHSVPDSDDSALAFKFLTSMGERLDPGVFDAWERDQFFQCFRYERDPSLSSNIHILDAVKGLRGYPNRDNAVDKITSFLGSRVHSGGFWQDKWHLSPYYATSHAVAALHGVDDSLVERAVSWIAETRKHNGMWGHGAGTREETAYALWALLYYGDNVASVDPELLVEGLGRLAGGAPGRLEELWIAKGLYCPVKVVESAILSVLCKAERAGLLAPPRAARARLEAPAIAAEGEVHGLG